MTINKGAQVPIETPFDFSITQNVCRPNHLSAYDTLQLIDLANCQTNNTPCGLAFPSSAPVEHGLRLAMNESGTMGIELKTRTIQHFWSLARLIKIQLLEHRKVSWAGPDVEARGRDR